MKSAQCEGASGSECLGLRLGITVQVDREGPVSTQSGGRPTAAASAGGHPLRTFKLTHPPDIDVTSRASPGTPSDTHASQVKRRCAVYARFFTAANIRYRSGCFVNRWTRPSRRRRWSSSIAASWRRPMREASARIVQPQSPGTCRVRTGVIATGPTNGYCVRPVRSAPTPRHSPRPSLTAPPRVARSCGRSAPGNGPDSHTRKCPKEIPLLQRTKRE